MSSQRSHLTLKSVDAELIEELWQYYLNHEDKPWFVDSKHFVSRKAFNQELNRRDVRYKVIAHRNGDLAGLIGPRDLRTDFVEAGIWLKSRVTAEEIRPILQRYRRSIVRRATKQLCVPASQRAVAESIQSLRWLSSGLLQIGNRYYRCFFMS